MDTITNEIFRPRLPPIWVPAVDISPQKRRNVAITGLANLLAQCAPDPNFIPTSTSAQLQEAQKREKKIAHEKLFAQGKQAYNPSSDTKHLRPVTNILFVARLKYTVTEEQLREHFKEFGTVENLHIVRDLKRESRGYGFIQFDSPRCVSRAIEGANNALLHGSRILVDKCRCLDRNWLPMRLGGGIGGRKSRVVQEPDNSRYASRITPRRPAFTQSPRNSTPYDRQSRGRGQRGGRGAFESRRGRGGRHDQSSPVRPPKNVGNRQDRFQESRSNYSQNSNNRHSRYAQDFDGNSQNMRSQTREGRRNMREPIWSQTNDTSGDRHKEPTHDSKPSGRTLRRY